jgi:hypothetical protein
VADLDDLLDVLLVRAGAVAVDGGLERGDARTHLIARISSLVRLMAAALATASCCPGTQAVAVDRSLLILSAEPLQRAAGRGNKNGGRPFS